MLKIKTRIPYIWKGLESCFALGLAGSLEAWKTYKYIDRKRLIVSYKRRKKEDLESEKYDIASLYKYFSLPFKVRLKNWIFYSDFKGVPDPKTLVLHYCAVFQRFND